MKTKFHNCRLSKMWHNLIAHYLSEHPEIFMPEQKELHLHLKSFQNLKMAQRRI